MRTCKLALQVAFTLTLTACKTTSPAYPPAADIAAVIEAKPKPPVEILTDPAASDRYSAAIEATLDRVHSAAVRLCQFHKSMGMRGLTCD
ncbi:hypothetical protein ASE49_09160 [Novosphingobium sp. Leaf2]|nr:hypothetical protein ASE49_09160 [Novosphingobium sp. Leaf2]